MRKTSTPKLADCQELETPAPAAAVRSDVPTTPRAYFRLASGREVLAHHDGTRDVLQVRSPRGRIELSIRFSEHGAELAFEDDALSISAPEHLRLEATTLHLQADEICLESNLGGAQRIGTSVDIRSATGDVRVESGRDTVVRGKRVFLND